MEHLESGTSRDGSVRKPAVAGLFYPSDRRELENSVNFYLADAAAKLPSTIKCPPKAIIVPHAGYKYSGLTAAAAYNNLKQARDRIKRVVMMGPLSSCWDLKHSFTFEPCF